MSLLQILLVGGVVGVAVVLAACLIGEVFGLNGRLDAADEDRNENWDWPQRIDQRRD